MSGRRHQSRPESYGWTKTGSNDTSRVEYYQRDNVKMDYYPTTGNVKTSMDHPSQGKTQMFRRDLSEDSFQNVLANPRSHTGQGYQRRR